MSDELALLRQVLEKPDDETPRQVYADFLEERGDPRSRFIRVQLDIEDLGPEDPRWLGLSEEELQLLDEHREAWEKPVRQTLPQQGGKGITGWLRGKLFSPGNSWYYRRGFVEEIECPASEFVANADVLFSHFPVRHLALHGAAGCLPALAADARLNGLKSLHLLGVDSQSETDALLSAAVTAGFKVILVKVPRYSDLHDWYDMRRAAMTPGTATNHPRAKSLISFWSNANTEQQQRLKELSASPRFAWLRSQADHRPGVLKLFDDVSFGSLLGGLGVWAIVKPAADKITKETKTETYVLLRPEKMNKNAYSALQRSGLLTGQLK